jgi:hypothetical protein
MTDVRQAGAPDSDADPAEEIQLDLARAVDMFERPQVELGSSHGTFQPGIELCIAELESRPTGRPVHLELTLPQSEISDGLEERLAVTMRRYCDERSYVNDCSRRSTQRSGVRALRIGLPVTLLGLTITAIAFHLGDSDDPQTAVVDILGWVLAWLGLWYPFDKLIFYASDFVRENRALEELRDAHITVVARPIEQAGEAASTPDRSAGGV